MRNIAKPGIKNILACLGMLLILYLFYRTIWVLILLLPCMVIYFRIEKKDRDKKDKAVLNSQFKGLLESLVASLRAGYSIENALREGEKEMMSVYGEDSPICRELRIMINQAGIGISAEQAFHELAKRSRAEDIETFASVFSIAKRTGGDMVEIIRKSAEDIGAKTDTKNEIDVLISSKRLEQNIMMLIPAGIILYVDISSPSLLMPLYGNLTGVVIMTVCLLVYIAAVLLARRLIRIEV